MTRETHSQVTPRDILDFWLALADDRLFSRDPALDREITEKFGAAHEAAKDGAYDRWTETPQGTAALIILLDQFARNIHRGRPQAYDADEKALGLARAAVDTGADLALAPELRQWVYLPFEHSEDMADQERAVALFERAGLDEGLKWARHHADIIRRFGRFPHRNAILGRKSTRREREYLADGGFGG